MNKKYLICILTLTLAVNIAAPVFAEENKLISIEKTIGIDDPINIDASICDEEIITMEDSDIALLGQLKEENKTLSNLYLNSNNIQNIAQRNIEIDTANKLYSDSSEKEELELSKEQNLGKVSKEAEMYLKKAKAEQSLADNCYKKAQAYKVQSDALVNSLNILDDKIKEAEHQFERYSDKAESALSSAQNAAEFSILFDILAGVTLTKGYIASITKTTTSLSGKKGQITTIKNNPPKYFTPKQKAILVSQCILVNKFLGETISAQNEEIKYLKQELSYLKQQKEGLIKLGKFNDIREDLLNQVILHCDLRDKYMQEYYRLIK